MVCSEAFRVAVSISLHPVRVIIRPRSKSSKNQKPLNVNNDNSRESFLKNHPWQKDQNNAGPKTEKRVFLLLFRALNDEGDLGAWRFAFLVFKHASVANKKYYHFVQNISIPVALMKQLRVGVQEHMWRRVGPR